MFNFSTDTKLSSHTICAAKRHGLTAGFSIDKTRGISSEGVIITPDGDIKRPNSDYGDWFIDETRLVRVDTVDCNDQISCQKLNETIQQELSHKNIAINAHALVYKKDTPDGARYTIQDPKDGLCQITHYIYPIFSKVSSFDGTDTVGDLNVLEDINIRLGNEVDMYSQWVNNLVYKASVEPISSHNKNLVQGDESGSIVVSIGNIYSRGTDDAVNGEPDRIAEHLIECLLEKAGETTDLALSVKGVSNIDDNVLDILVNNIQEKFSFSLIFNRLTITPTQSKDTGKLALTVTNTSIPSLTTIANNYILNTKCDDDGFLDCNFLEKLSVNIGVYLGRSGLTGMYSTLESLKLSQFLAEYLMHNALLDSQPNYNGYYKKDADEMPDGLLYCIIFTIVQLSMDQYTVHQIE